MKYQKTILQMVVHRENVSPIYGEGNTYVTVEDEGAGPFLILEQHEDTSKVGAVRMDYEEFLVVAEVAKELMHQMTIELETLTNE